MPQRPDLPCADCGKLMWRGTGSLPEGKARCHPCRKANPKTKPSSKSPCVDCGTPAYGQRCRACANKAKVHLAGRTIVRHEDDPHTTRLRREQAAPGLTAHQRSRLLARWKSQGKRCSYCATRRADTVDHVVPLIRGGTNYEGNLTPCCRRCNGSKSGLMVAEWRHGHRVAPRPSPLPWRSQTKRPAPKRRWAKQQALLPVSACRRYYTPVPKVEKRCAECGDAFRGTPNRRFCGPKCNKRASERRRRSTALGKQRRREQKARARARRRQDPRGEGAAKAP